MSNTLNTLKQWTPNLVQLSDAIAKAETGFENGRPEAGMMEAFHYLLGLAYDELNNAPIQKQRAAVLAPNWAGEFKTYEQWVNKGQSWLKSQSHRPAICVDAKGRRCALGADMIRARDEGAFPVRYFWDCEPAPSIIEKRPTGETRNYTPSPEYAAPVPQRRYYCRFSDGSEGYLWLDEDGKA